MTDKLLEARPDARRITLEDVGHFPMLEDAERTADAIVSLLVVIRVHLIDGTYELFRHFYGQRDETTRTGTAAVRGVLSTVLQQIEDGGSHIAVATDHVIESFRNRMWTGYKTSAGMDPELLSVFPLLEDALMAMGVATFAMVELEADDALATVAAVAAEDHDVEQVRHLDARQGPRSVRARGRARRAGRPSRRQGHQRRRRAREVRRRPRVDPRLPRARRRQRRRVPRPTRASAPRPPRRCSSTTSTSRTSPTRVGQWEVTLRGGGTLAATLAEHRDLVGLFKELATLRVDRQLLDGVNELEWHGPTPDFGVGQRSSSTAPTSSPKAPRRSRARRAAPARRASTSRPARRRKRRRRARARPASCASPARNLLAVRPVQRAERVEAGVLERVDDADARCRHRQRGRRVARRRR